MNRGTDRNLSPLVIIAWLLLHSISFASENDPIMRTCGGFDPTGLTEGKPVVRVEPVVGADLREDGVDSCIVLVYGLKEKRGSEGAALVAYKPKAVSQSDGVGGKEMKAAERAMSKWLFLAKTHDASKKPVYYSVVFY